MSSLKDSKTLTIDSRGMRDLLTTKSKIKSWLEVEVALAKVQSELNIIPVEAYQDIKDNAKIENIDLIEMDQIMKKIGHNFVPFVKLLSGACSENGSKYVHYGVTTQNIQQTANMMRLKKFTSILLDFLKEIIVNWSNLAKVHANTIIAARTHGKHALPITYGYKICSWIDELDQAYERIIAAQPRTFVSMMGGAVGAFHAFNKEGVLLHELVANELDLTAMNVPSRSINVFLLEYMSNMSLLCTTLHKIAEDIYHSSGEEFDEVSEPFENGTVGSSTMPQKINPKLSKGIISNSLKLYSTVNSSFYGAVKPFEANSASYHILEGNLFDIQEIVVEIITRSHELSSGLVVKKEKMLQNVKLTNGLINSENIMLKLVDKLGKSKAHELVYELAMQAVKENRPYNQILLENEIVNSCFTKLEITTMIDPSAYIGMSNELAIELSDKFLKKYQL